MYAINGIYDTKNECFHFNFDKKHAAFLCKKATWFCQNHMRVNRASLFLYKGDFYVAIKKNVDGIERTITMQTPTSLGRKKSAALIQQGVKEAVAHLLSKIGE